MQLSTRCVSYLRHILRAKEVMFFFLWRIKKMLTENHGQWFAWKTNNNQCIEGIFGVGNIWVFPNIGVPQNGWFIMENPMKMDDLGGKPTIFGNIHIFHSSQSFTSSWGSCFFRCNKADDSSYGWSNDWTGTNHRIYINSPTPAVGLQDAGLLLTSFGLQ